MKKCYVIAKELNPNASKATLAKITRSIFHQRFNSVTKKATVKGHGRGCFRPAGSSAVALV